MVRLLTFEDYIRHFILKYVSLTVALVVVASAQTVFVPSTHWVYDYLDRLETKRIVPVVLAGTKPMTRKEIALHLVEIEKQRDRLYKTEAEQLDYLLFEFQEHVPQKTNYLTRIKSITELSWTKSWWPNWLYPQGRHLLEIDGGPLKINFDPIFYRSRLFANDDTLSAQERVNMDTNGFLLWGTVGHHFGYYTDIRDTREWGRQNYPRGNTTGKGLGFVQGNGEQIYHDETLAYLLFSKSYLNIQFGKDSNVWGPGYRGQLFLSNSPTSYDQFKLQLVFDRMKYTYILAWLKHYTPDYYKGNPRTKMMSLHRFEFSPHRLVDIGLHSGVIYAGREFEPSYANPVMFFRSAEHYLGDTDNAVMGLDVELKAIKNTKLCGELFLDDLTTSKLGTGFYGNKFGVTGGFFYVDVFGLPNLDLRAEYTAIRPFVYSHKDTVTTYAHFITPLGHPAGPNSENLFVQAQYRLSRRWLVDLSVENYRFGANTALLNVGRDPFRPRDFMTDPDIISLLDGVKHDVRTMRFHAEYEFMRNAFLEFNVAQIQTDIDEQSDRAYPVGRSQFEVAFRMNY